MFPAHILNSLIRGTQPSNSHVLTLTAGQVLRGEVVKLLDDQLAIVRLGNMHVQAKLEAPIEVGQKSWFQVQAAGQPITLKLIPAPHASFAQGQSELLQLLSFFGLKSSPAGERMIQFFLQEQLPMTKQSLRSASLIAEQLGTKAEILHAIKFGVLRGLPLTKEVIQSVQSFSNAPSILTQLKNLEALLPERPRAELHSLMQKMTQDAAAKPNGLLLFLQRMGVQFEASLSRESMGKGSLPQSPVSSTPHPVSNIGINDSGQARPAFAPVFSPPLQHKTQETGAGLENQRWRMTNQTIRVDGKASSANLEQPVQSNNRAPANAPLNFNHLANAEGQPLVSTHGTLRLGNQTVPSTFINQSGQEAHPANRSNEGSSQQNTASVTERGSVVFQSQGLGRVAETTPGTQHTSVTNQPLQHTGNLQHITNDVQQVVTLKSYLLGLLEQQSLSKLVKDKIQSLVQTIQGQQILLSTESQQNVQTFIFQAFYPFGEDLQSIYGQLSGKRDRSGRIDPENCRMLFHLDLQHLGETEIDVSIQSSYLSIVFYSKNVPVEGNSWLKENEEPIKGTLGALGYTLTSVKWKEIQQSTGPRQNPVVDQVRFYSQGSFQGVDIRL